MAVVVRADVSAKTRVDLYVELMNRIQNENNYKFSLDNGKYTAICVDQQNAKKLYPDPSVEWDDTNFVILPVNDLKGAIIKEP